MIERKTILDQIEQIRRMLPHNIGTDLDMLTAGIKQEPMGFAMSPINRLQVLAAAIENLTITCEHALDFQRNEARDKAREKK